MTYCDRWNERTTNDTEGLKCPYCGYLDRDAYELFHGFDEDGQEIKCGSCDKTFWSTRSIRITYYGAPAVEDQEKPK